MSIDPAVGKPIKKIRVLVFGATGIGKTSMCNTLTGRNRATDNGAKRVTAKTHIYPSVDYAEHSIEILDTAGLHESAHGTVPAERAVVALVELLEQARDGFSVLLHVARASRITKEHDEDYALFVDKLTQKKIPVILAISGCENEDPMQGWVERNKDAFTHFDYADLIATCWASGATGSAICASSRAIA